MNTDNVKLLVARVQNGDITAFEAICRVVVEAAKGRLPHSHASTRPLLEIIPQKWGGNLVQEVEENEPKSTQSVSNGDDKTLFPGGNSGKLPG